MRPRRSSLDRWRLWTFSPLLGESRYVNVLRLSSSDLHGQLYEARRELYKIRETRLARQLHALIHHYLRPTASHLMPAPCSCISIVMQR